MSHPDFVTADELAKILKVSVNTIYAMEQANEIPKIRVRSNVRFDVAKVLTALEAQS